MGDAWAVIIGESLCRARGCGCQLRILPLSGASRPRGDGQSNFSGALALAVTKQFWLSKVFG